MVNKSVEYTLLKDYRQNADQGNRPVGGDKISVFLLVIGTIIRVIRFSAMLLFVFSVFFLYIFSRLNVQNILDTP